VEGRQVDLVEVFADDRRFEQDRLPHLEDGDLAQGREAQKPIGLVFQVDVGDVVLNPFFVQQDDRPLDVGSELETDQFGSVGHKHLLLSPTIAPAGRISTNLAGLPPRLVIG
jgi:hypothetical protein